jgi:arginine metabolism regulation protein II
MFRSHTPASTIHYYESNWETEISHRYSQLDDFLRIQPHITNNDDDMEANKDDETGLHDIHLEDTRTWTNTLYMDIYGIPEIWLSYVSQITRVANIMDYLDATSMEPTRTFQQCLQKKTVQLEDQICSFSAQNGSPRDLPPLNENQSDVETSGSTMASRAMMRAMTSALLILFYRRVKKVHPFILQPHVDNVIRALEDFDLAQDILDLKLPGTPWPAFIAGSEAMSMTARDWFAGWMQKGAMQSAFNGFSTATQVMRKVWDHRDGINEETETNSSGSSQQQTSGRKKEKKNVYSWVDALREDNFWPMLY